MNKELAIITIGYLIGYYKSHDEVTINSDEIDAINFILKDNENLEQQCKKQKEVIDKAVGFIKSKKCKYDGWEMTVQLYENEINQLLNILEEVK